MFYKYACNDVPTKLHVARNIIDYCYKIFSAVINGNMISALEALQAFTNMMHCAGDRCTICTFDKDLVYRQKLENSVNWRNINTSNNTDTRLYDSICDVVDHLYDNGRISNSWIIVIIIYNNDNISIRSADECKRHILTKYASGMKNRHVFLVSVGSNVDCAKLKSLQIDECLYHVHVKRHEDLKTDLIMKICFCGAIAEKTLAMDYVICVNNSAGAFVAPLDAQPLIATPAAPQQVLAQSKRPLIATPAAPQQMSTQSAPQQVLCKQSLTATPAAPQQVLAQSKQPQVAPQQHATPSNTQQPQVAPQQHATPSDTQDVTIKMRQFSKKHLHPSDMKIFAKFALANYPGIPTSWEEDDLIFFVLIESEKRSIVGMLVMMLHDDSRVHIRLMVVKPEYRKHGLGTNMLKYIADKYMNRTITLNVAFDRLDLLNYYYDKGYVKFEEFSTKHKVIVFSLVHKSLTNT